MHSRAYTCLATAETRAFLIARVLLSLIKKKKTNHESFRIIKPPTSTFSRQQVMSKITRIPDKWAWLDRALKQSRALTGLAKDDTITDAIVKTCKQNPGLRDRLLAGLDRKPTRLEAATCSAIKTAAKLSDSDYKILLAGLKQNGASVLASADVVRTEEEMFFRSLDGSSAGSRSAHPSGQVLETPISIDRILSPPTRRSPLSCGSRSSSTTSI